MMFVFEYFPERYNMTPQEILDTPTPTVWYLYDRYLLYMHQLGSSLPGDSGKDMIDSDLVKENLFPDWNERTAPPAWLKEVEEAKRKKMGVKTGG